ncbi:MAG: CoA transferase [Comamonas sp.]
MPSALANACAESTHPALAAMWRDLDLPADALARLAFCGAAPGFASHFAVVQAAQISAGAAALAATEIERQRAPGRPAQGVVVDATHAAFETSGYFTLDGQQPDLWAPISGLYACGHAVGAPGWVRIHANFDHHRDGALALLGLATGPDTARTAVEQALQHWRADDFEAQAAARGLPVAAARSSAQWQALGHEAVLAAQELVAITRIGAAPPLPWPALAEADKPLAGLRVLDLTRIIAGPVAGRTLAAHGADVMLVNGPHLPNIEALADTSRGKRSAQLDLRATQGRQALRDLVAQSQVFLQAYRPGALAAKGFAAEELARLRPGLVVAELSAYGWQGPWAGRRGFDSLVQTATGVQADEALARGQATPRALPMQILDYSAGFLLALGIQAALLRQAREGGSWQVRVTLAGVARWLRALGPVEVQGSDWDQPKPDITPYLERVDSGFGVLRAVRHCAVLSRCAPGWERPSVPPGTDAAAW